MNYSQIRKENDDDINSVPMFFAFNQEQLSNELAKLGVEESEIIATIGGGFMRKSDKHLLSEASERCEKRINDFMSTDDGLISALRYELANYEFDGYDPTEALEALDLNLQDERVQRCLPQAIKQLGPMMWA